TIDRGNAGQFWSSYLANNGEKGTPGGHPIAASGPLAGKRVWSPDVWNSARCDTAQGNLYAYQGIGVQGGPYGPYYWMATYHESDPHFNTLGITRNRCFVRCKTCAVTDVICDGTVPTDNLPGGYLPVGTAGTTKECTKIIPDGLLTPGSHVEYF